jgi:hypothetical protein
MHASAANRSFVGGGGRGEGLCASKGLAKCKTLVPWHHCALCHAQSWLQSAQNAAIEEAHDGI